MQYLDQYHAPLPQLNVEGWLAYRLLQGTFKVVRSCRLAAHAKPYMRKRYIDVSRSTVGVLHHSSCEICSLMFM